MPPAVGTSAPNFSLPDAHTGTKRKLSEFAMSRRPVALFFFCGCSACHAVAAEWATLQRGDALPANAATMIVYSTTDRAEARARVAASGLDKRQTAVLCDTEDLSVTERLYHAEPCLSLTRLVGSSTEIPEATKSRRMPRRDYLSVVPCPRCKPLSSQPKTTGMTHDADDALTGEIEPNLWKRDARTAFPPPDK